MRSLRRGNQTPEVTPEDRGVVYNQIVTFVVTDETSDVARVGLGVLSGETITLGPTGKIPDIFVYHLMLILHHSLLYLLESQQRI